MPATPQTFNLTARDIALSRVRGDARALVSAEPVLDIDQFLRIYRLDDLQHRPKPNWLIGQIVEELGLTIFFGPDKVGKTAVISSILWSWCAGHTRWMGEDAFEMNDPSPDEDDLPRERSVLYLLMEGQASYYERYEAWKLANGYEGDMPNFWVADDMMALFSSNMDLSRPDSWPESAQKLYSTVKELRPQILVLDTLSRATAGMDENSPQMATLVGFLDMLRVQFGTAAIVVHHTALADGDRPRGHSSLKGAASSYVRITVPKQSEGKLTDNFTLIVGPHRNAAAINQEHGNYHGWPMKKKTYADSFIVEQGYASQAPRVAPTPRGGALVDLLQSGPKRWEELYEAIYGEPIADPGEEKKGKQARKLNKLAEGLPIVKTQGLWSLGEIPEELE